MYALILVINVHCQGLPGIDGKDGTPGIPGIKVWMSLLSFSALKLIPTAAIIIQEDTWHM